ncbi:unnamed protein product [Notodromas monacha]|uniref:Amino acid transporter transmembrane domain-containing protein n=1 Tax=Notodromas monacha TaxID=399045 RepID=A0A7R9BFE3_9CRUS|nr:unnamed protein product [Notodromas monacha]CAG0912822.1 unnamed protein product [Notodromas monacha]
MEPKRIFEIGVGDDGRNSGLSTPARPGTPSSVPTSRPSTPTGRRPFHYYGTVGRPPSSLEAGTLEPSRVSDASISEQNVYMRYKYYSRLRQRADSSEAALLIPDHVVPSSFFIPLLPLPDLAGRQSSVVTIFAIWNTMMGTSLLSMPWAIQRAGVILGSGLLLLMFMVCLYTAYRTVNAQSNAGITGDVLELPQLMRLLLGRWAECATLLASILALVGASIAYWILLTNFLYSMVKFIENEIEMANKSPDFYNYTVANVICPSKNISDELILGNSSFDEFWSLNLTAPLVLFLLLFPLMNVKSPSFFMKFNAMGTISVFFIAVFIGVKVGEWGFHVNIHDDTRDDYVALYSLSSAHVLTGVLSLAMFTHNVIITIMSNQRHPENNGRDLSAAYVLVTITYCSVGLLFWLAFPLAKDCIEDNLLNNFSGNDVLAAVARCFLLFQLTTVFPLLTYVIRSQIMYVIYETVYPGFWHVLFLNLLIAILCVLFTIFLPQIGTIIRFAGAFCGMVLVFTLPCVAYMAVLRRQGKLSFPIQVFHGLLIAGGLLNLALQFVGGD